ncbi:IPT/TIG domain-containing protein [Pseudoxanthomonas sp. z9]|uniref:IPT/TIG domain-containing protein n=1 Tax=Pseudoxanthomonas sp. z9 TaxID=2584942 RepID=UPI0015E8CF4F|nr:IPT/TIG domain-containing protein [Pseudoxanthomonas sp. z9]
MFWRAWKAVIALMIFGVAASLAGATTYLYDANGRLVVATNEEGAHARYVYDAVGNLQGIERLRPDELAIFSMEPGRGAPGAHVLIRGQGFSAATAGNRVAFNGTAAEVVRASPTSLTVVVPAGATTGFVAVEAGGVSTVSTSAFVVDENEAPPVIRRIAPLRVAVGATVGIDGEHLMPIPGQSKVSVSGRFVSSARESAGNHIDFVVPANVGSGKVRVTTPFGKAESDEDLIVLPRDVSPADVETVHRIAPGSEPVSLGASGSGKWVVVLFDGKLGDYLSIQSDPGTGSAVEYVVRDPANQILAKGSLSASLASLHLPALNKTGSYAIYMKRAPEAGSWRLSVEVDPTQAIDGESRALGVWAPGQSKRFLLSGRIGDNLGLGISELDAPGGSYARVEVYRPDGTQLRYRYCYVSDGGCDVNLSRLSAGTYAVVMEPAWSRQQVQFKVTLSTDVTGLLSPDEWKTLALDRYGQNGRLSFTGTAGQRLGLQVSGQQTLPADRNVYYTVYAPDRTLLTSGTLRGGGALDLPALPADGSYQVFVDPYYGETLTAQLRLATGTAEGLGVTNTPAAYEARGTGEAAYFTFTARDGDNLGLGISELRISGGSYAYVRVYRPDGKRGWSSTCYLSHGGCEVNLPRLSAGTYAVVVEPASSTQRLQFKATLSADVTGELVPDAWTPLILSRPGQNGRLDFTGTASQRLGLQVSGQQTLPADGNVYYTVYAPDRTLLTSGTLRGGGALDLPALPADGSYQVFVDPYYGETLTAQLRLATGTAEGLGVTNAPAAYEARGTGEAAYFTFTARDGDNLGLGISELRIPGGSYAYVEVYRPDGTQLRYRYCYVSDGGCDVNLPRLSAGTYAVVVEPASAGQRLQFKATLSADVTGELVSDAWTPLTLSRLGQNGRLHFTGTAGQRLGLQVSGHQTLPVNWDVYYTVYAPDRTLLTSKALRGGGALDLPALPADGSYQVFVDPAHGKTLTAQLRLATGTAEGLGVANEPISYEARGAGEAAYFTFTAKDGDNLGLGISELQITPENWHTYSYVQVYRPDGKQGWSSTCYVSDGGCDVNLSRLSAGTYAVVVEPVSAGQRLQFKASLSADGTGELVPDAWKTLVLSRPGQNGRLSFTGTAGQRLGLQVSGQQTLPANRYVYYYVYTPQGSLLTSRSVRTGDTLDLPVLPADGTYQVFVDPEYGETLTAQLRLATGTAEGLGVANASVSYEARGVGEAAYFTFTARDGDNLGLGISELRIPGGSNARVEVYRPDGTQLRYRYCYASDGGCDVNLPRLSAGTYAVVVEPVSSTQRLQFKVTLSADVTGELVPDAWTPLTLNRPGQNGRLHFTGTAGQRLGLQTRGQQTLPANRHVYYYVYTPQGSLLTSRSMRAGGTLDLPVLPVDGTYQVFVDSEYGETLTAQLRLATGTAEGLGVANAPAAYEARGAGEAAYFTFTAREGDNLGLGLSELADNEDRHAYLRVYRPDGTQLRYRYCYVSYGGCDVNLPRLSAGTYAVVVEPASSTQRLQFKVTLSADVTGELVPDAWTPLTLSRPGQNGRLHFTGTAGQRLGLQVSGQQTLPADRNVYYYVYAPDLSLLTSGALEGGGTLRMPALPKDGPYQIFVDPAYGETLTAQLRSATGTAEGLGVANGPVAYEARGTGEAAYFTFTAREGDNLGLGISEMRIVRGNSAYLDVYRPNGDRMMHGTCSAGCRVNLPNLPAGIYVVIVKQSPVGRQFQFKATLSADKMGLLLPDDWKALVLDRPGQGARLSFTGTAGQRLSLQVRGQRTVPADRHIRYEIYSPNGRFLTSRALRNDGTQDLPALPTDGTYQVFVDPIHGETMTVQLRLAVKPPISSRGRQGRVEPVFSWRTARIRMDAGPSPDARAGRWIQDGSHRLLPMRPQIGSTRSMACLNTRARSRRAAGLKEEQGTHHG